jgi:NADPH-dependent 2,4-dienoyl-CoA reductase/sulfur reductase-like enzyme
VLATGVRPDVGIAVAAGLEVGESGALRTDDRQRCAGADGVFAAGDCVESHHRVLGRGANVQLGTHANKQGRIAGANATGGDLAFPGIIGTAISRICDTEVARTGVSEREAAMAGFDVVAETIESDTRARYMPGRGDIRVKLVAERGSGRLLGAQVVGAETSGKRIDTLAMAVWNEMDVRDLQWVDLSYAPPVSGVLDPVLVAARATAKLV